MRPVFSLDRSWSILYCIQYGEISSCSTALFFLGEGGGERERKNKFCFVSVLFSVALVEHFRAENLLPLAPLYKKYPVFLFYFFRYKNLRRT